MTKLYNKIKKGYINSKLFKYFNSNEKIIKKLFLLKDIFFGIYTISFAFFVIFLLGPYYLFRYFNFTVLISDNIFLIINNLTLAAFGLFLFSFSLFLIIFFALKKYNQYLKFIDEE